MTVLYDDLDERFDDYTRFDLENIFDNESSNKKYVMFGKAETYDIKGELAKGYCNRIFDSLLNCIDDAISDVGICYLKIYEENYGRLYIDVIHHDGRCEFEVRELTNRGEEVYNNHYYDEDIVKRLIDVKKYTRNVKFTKRYY